MDVSGGFYLGFLLLYPASYITFFKGFNTNLGYNRVEVIMCNCLLTLLLAVIAVLGSDTDNLVFLFTR